MKKKYRTRFLRRYLLPLVICILMASFVMMPQTNAADYSATIDGSTTYQTIEGFGAATAWYQSWLTEHPYKNEIYDLLFQGLGLDILRLRNQYRNDPNFDYEDTEIVEMAELSLGHPIRVLLSSWTPPADLKVDGVLNGGTLIQEDGAFVYSKFAEYWYNSLNAYAAKGIVPYYISIQNEPDYENSGWETCIFKPVETSIYPGYGKALDAVYTKLQTMETAPKILGPEICGIGSSLVQTYADNMDLSQVYGIAHHLYNGGDSGTPDSFIANMQSLSSAFSNYPLFQTEYDQGTALGTALLIHNSLVYENVSAYLFWDLVWDTNQRPLIALENPWSQSSWTSTKGYIISDFYYALKHYAKFTDPGFKRVEASSGSSDIKVSAFISEDNNQLAVVFINNGSTASSIALNLNNFTIDSSAVYRTVPGGTERFAEMGSLGSGNTVDLPAQSITTVVIYSPSYQAPDIPAPLPTPTPAPDSRSAFTQIEAESYNSQSGIQTALIDDNDGRCVDYIENGDYLLFTNVDFGDGAKSFQARVASNTNGGYIEVRLDSLGGTLVGTATVPSTGGWSTWTDVTCDLSGPSGVHDLYLKFTGSSGYLFNLDWFQFIEGTPTPITGYLVSYVIQSDWGNGSTISVTITNKSTAAVDGWTLAWTFPGDQVISNLWNGSYTQSGTSVTVNNLSYNSTIPIGGTVSFGFNLTYSGTNAKPTRFTLNGTECEVQ